MQPRSPLSISFFLLIVVGALLFLAGQNQSQINIFQDLERNGTTMQAKVLEVKQKRSRRGSPRYRVRYDYQVGKAAYESSARIDKDEFQTLKEGDRIPVTYSPDLPAVSTFKPSAQVETERLEQTFAILGALAAMTWLVFEIRKGKTIGWTNNA